MTKECNCEFCIRCKCGHRADEHLAGIGQCFLCSCAEHSDKSWKEKEIASMAEQRRRELLSIARKSTGKG